jgi:3-methyladenine DNA glycosylase AlkD
VTREIPTHRSKPSARSAWAGSPERVAKRAETELKRLARAGGHVPPVFDARRYFRGTPDLGFYNLRTSTLRALARAIHQANRDNWSIDEAMRFANLLIVDRFLETKGVGVELVARYRRVFSPRLLPIWKRWLANNHSANWATTDSICGVLIGPLLEQHPKLLRTTGRWSRAKNLWVRRASAVSLIRLARQGKELAVAYDVAKSLHADDEDLIQKAVGWLLREAGKTDPARLERYLRVNGPAIPRVTVRYAIERFPLSTRRELLAVTKKAGGAGRAGGAGGAGRSQSTIDN